MPTPQFMEAFEATRIQVNNPVFAVDTGGDDLATWANGMISRGRAHVVIDELAQRQDLDENHYALHILGNAYKYRGNAEDLPRAESLLRRALVLRRERLAATPSEQAATAVASTLSVLGEVAFIQGEHERADALFVEAINVKPTFWLAHECRLCMRSVAEDGPGCGSVLADLDRTYPAWRSDEELVQTILEDGMLDWFRSQPHLLSALAQH